MSLRHPKPAPATPSAGKRAGELVGQFECPLIRQLQRQMGTDRFDRDRIRWSSSTPALASRSGLQSATCRDEWALVEEHLGPSFAGWLP